MDTIFKITKIAINILVGIVGVLAIVLLVGSFGIIPQFKTYVVSSGSMEPALRTGSIVMVAKAPSYNSKDIISFKNSEAKDDVVTHRIVSRIYSNDLLSSPSFYTKGDANSDIDQSKVKEEQIVGKVFFSLPFLGYFTEFVKKPYGFILFVVMPATIIIYEELKTLKKEIKIWFLKFRKKTQEENSLSGSGISKMFFVIPILAAAIAISSFSISFFSDKEQSLVNTMVAGAWVTPTPSSAPSPSPSPSPAPPRIVINEVYYDVSPDKGNEGDNSNPDEWVELYNNTGNPINLKDWAIIDNSTARTISHSSVYIPANGFALLAKNASTWTLWGIPAGVEKISLGQKIGNGLANNGDQLVLKDDLGIIIDQMSYGDDITILNPSCTDVVEGHSLERDPDGKDIDAASDFIDRNPPTPGS